MKFIHYDENATSGEILKTRKEFIEKYYGDYRSQFLMAQRLRCSHFTVSGILTRMGGARKYPALTSRRMSKAEEELCVQDFLKELPFGVVDFTALSQKYRVTVDRLASILLRRDVLDEKTLQHVAFIDLSVVYEETVNAKRVSLKPKDVVYRKCLCCGEEFISTHIGNRLCSPCKSTYY